MFRLAIAIAASVLVGIAIGALQFKSGYSNIDERFGDFAAPPPLEAVAANKDAVTSADPFPTPGKAKLPKVEVPGGTTHDFGTMQQGSKKSHAFVFKNIGTAPMTLQVLSSSCRCTIGTLADPILEPGEETEVKLEWKATGVLDQFSQTATIGTTDPDHRNVLLSVKGIVARTILVEPPAITLGDIPIGHELHREAYVFGYGEVPMEVKAVTWGDDRTTKMVDIKVTPIEIDMEKFPHHARAKGAARIDLTIKDNMPLGPINSRLVVDTNIENVTNVDLPVDGSVVGDIQFLPNPSYDSGRFVLSFDTIPHGAGATRKMFLSVQGKHRDDLVLEVGDVVPKESLQVEIGQPTKQQTRTIFPITCTVPKDAPVAMFPGTNPQNFGKVVLKTNHPDIPEVKLNLRLIVE